MDEKSTYWSNGNDLYHTGRKDSRKALLLSKCDSRIAILLSLKVATSIALRGLETKIVSANRPLREPSIFASYILHSDPSSREITSGFRGAARKEALALLPLLWCGSYAL